MSDQWAVYKQRWFVLFVALFCNVCAGLVSSPARNKFGAHNLFGAQSAVFSAITKLTQVSPFAPSRPQLWMPYSTVTDLAAKYYQVPQTMISLLPASIFVSSALLGIPAMWVLDRKNLKTGVRVCGA